VTTLSSELKAIVAAEITAAGGREVSFVARVDEHGVIVDARAVARGTASAVLALPGVAARGEIVLHNHPSGDLDPSMADLDVAARMHDDGIGFGIVDNAAERLYMVVEVPRPRETVAIDPVAAADALGPGGIVAGVLGEFENRASQRDMAAYVADVYNDGGVSLLEAGTGVGKSFAYLVPAIEWSYANGERTVVSTNTINLQEQLVGKDLPLLARAFVDRDRPPTYALLKGWNNYLCLARLQLALGGQASLLEPERQGELVSLAEHTARVRALRSLFPVRSPAARGGGRRGGGEPPSAGGRSCGAARPRQLAGGRGAAALSPVGAGRGAPPRRCCRAASRHAGHVARHVTRAGATRAQRQGTAPHTPCRAGTRR
jgi:ATP-dependent DNA helicase DinG